MADEWPSPSRDFPPIDTPMDLERISKAVREILEAIGEDPDRDGLHDTPERVARMYAEICSGLHEQVDTHLAVTFEAGHDEMVMVRDIPMQSICEHHPSRSSAGRTWRTSPVRTGGSRGSPSWPAWSTPWPAARRCRRT
jgi:hypothetical protein